MTGFAHLPSHVRAMRPVKVLEANLEKGKLAHAILLKGENILELESVAHAIANCLFQSEKPVENHPDFFSLRPAKKARSIVVGSRNGDEPNSMRKLIRDLQQSSNQGGYKVAVVYEADRMNAAAANAFLKTLEEPPRQTLLLLISTRPYDLLDTIRSRCFQFKIPSKPPTSKIPEWKSWLDQYKKLLLDLHLRPSQSRKQPHLVIFSIYGLLSQFVVILDNAAEEVWKSQSNQLSESISDEEKVAIEVGLRKQVRDGLLIEIEEATRLAAIQMSHSLPFPSMQLCQAISELEKISGLMALNMKDEVALESFMLKLLRIWSER